MKNTMINDMLTKKLKIENTNIIHILYVDFIFHFEVNLIFQLDRFLISVYMFICS